MTDQRGDFQPLPERFAERLGEPGAYPGDPGAARGLELRQTHISLVFLSPERVYKLRKAVRPGFLDFGTRAARNADCLREVALNRRLAPDVYLGVAPVREGPSGTFEVGPIGDSLEAKEYEHCVVMRRLPEDRNGRRLLEADQLSSEQVNSIARVIARFHGKHALGRPAPFSPGGWLSSIAGPLEDALAPLSENARDGRAERLSAVAREFLRVHGDRFELRRRDGRAVDAHGDLHLEHVWFEASRREPLFVDCLEFSETLRHIDTASEVAFLAMDLAYRGAGDLAEFFLRRYARESDDFGLYGVVDYFVSYRAAVRARVAVMAAEDAGLPEAQRLEAEGSAKRHLELALRALSGKARGALVVVTGIVGTGKSTAAEAAADASGGIVVSSDRVRKRLAGMDASERAPAGMERDLYSEEVTERVYAGLLERAAAGVASGRVVILDATYSRRSRREQAALFARRRGLPLLVLETLCPAAEAQRRLAERERIGEDPSDAGPSLHPVSAARFEPIEDREPGVHAPVRTEDPNWRENLARRVRDWRSEAALPDS